MSKFKNSPHCDATNTLHDLLVEGQKLIDQLEELHVLDERAALLVCARISGRLDEGPFGDRMRHFGQGVKTAVKGSLTSAVAVNKKVQELGRLLKNTQPVQNFDQRFRDLKDTLARKYPATANAVSKYGDFAKVHPVCQAFVLALLAAAAALGTGHIVSTAVVMGMLRAGNELLKGADLSTAVGKAVSTGAIGWLAGVGIRELASAIAQVVVPFPSNFKTTFGDMPLVEWVYQLNGRIVINYKGYTTEHMARSLQKVFDLFNEAMSKNDDIRAAKLYKLFTETANSAFSSEIQTGIINQNAADLTLRTTLEHQANVFAATMAKVGRYVTAGMAAGVTAGKQAVTPAQSPAPTGQPQQAVQRPATAPKARIEPTFTPNRATPSVTAPSPAGATRKPANEPLWRQAVTAFRQQAQTDPRGAAQQIADRYKALGGAWA